MVSFERLGDLPGGCCYSEALDVSADGSVVVGRSGSGNHYSAFRFENGVMTALTDNGPQHVTLTSANCISADGSVIAGTGVFGDGSATQLTAYRMTDGIVAPFHSYSYMAPARFTVAGMSAEADRIVACFHGQDYPTQTFICVSRGEFELSTGADKINGISADGMVIVGRGKGPTCFQEALIYKDGATTWLGNLMPGGVCGYSEAFAASADGSVVVGSAACCNGYQAFVYKDGIMSGLDFPCDAQVCSSTALDVSADGSVVVGIAEFDEGVYQAVMWRAEDAFVPVVLNDLLDQHGVDRAGFSLVRATAVSADGTTIVGVGEHADTTIEAFRVQIIDPVEFADAGLEQAVREALGKPEGFITPQDMESLTTLYAYVKSIQSLQGIEFACNLETLVLTFNAISDITPLAGLTRLRILELGFNSIKDVSPLAGLTDLQQLYLNHNLVSDISPLRSLHGLQDRLGHPGLDLQENYLEVATGEPTMAMIYEIIGQCGNLSVLYAKQMPFSCWAGYPVRPDGSVDTAGQFGELYVQDAPWVFCTRLGSYIYMQESCAAACEGWIYACDFDCLQLYLLRGMPWGYSFCLNRWLYVPDDSVDSGFGWAYLCKAD